MNLNRKSDFLCIIKHIKVANKPEKEHKHRTDGDLERLQLFSQKAMGESKGPTKVRGENTNN